jgi:hypothetical protein
MYDVKYGIWMRVPFDMQFDVTMDSPLFIRRRDIQPADLDEQCKRFFPSAKPTHLRYDITAERRQIRKALRLVDTISITSESESENSPTKAGKKRFADLVDSPEFGQQRYRQRHLSPVRIEEESDAENLLPTLGSLSHQPLLIPLPPPLLETPTRDESMTPPHSQVISSVAQSTLPVRWPHNLYAIDVYKGFRSMDALEETGLSLEERFVRVFRTRFIKSTYHDARRRWILASQGQRNAALSAGHSALGLWSRFAREIPLKH